MHLTCGLDIKRHEWHQSQKFQLNRTFFLVSYNHLKWNGTCTLKAVCISCLVTHSFDDPNVGKLGICWPCWIYRLVFRNAKKNVQKRGKIKPKRATMHLLVGKTCLRKNYQNKPRSKEKNTIVDLFFHHPFGTARRSHTGDWCLWFVPHPFELNWLVGYPYTAQPYHSYS